MRVLVTGGTGFVGAHCVHDLYRVLEQVVGYRLWTVPMPYRLAYAAGRAAEFAQRRGIDPGFSSSEAWIIANYPSGDDDETRRDLGVQWRSTADTLRDEVAWLHEQGLVSTKHAGTATGSTWQPGEAVGPDEAV